MRKPVAAATIRTTATDRTIATAAGSFEVPGDAAANASDKGATRASAASLACHRRCSRF